MYLSTWTGKEQEEHRQQQASGAVPAAGIKSTSRRDQEHTQPQGRRARTWTKQLSANEYFEEGKDRGASASHELEKPDATTQFPAAEALSRADSSLLFDARDAFANKSSKGKGHVTSEMRRKKPQFLFWQILPSGACVRRRRQHARSTSLGQHHDSDKSWYEGPPLGTTSSEGEPSRDSQDGSSERVLAETVCAGRDVRDNSRNSLMQFPSAHQVLQPFTQSGPSSTSLKSKFRNFLLGGLHKGTLERALAHDHAGSCDGQMPRYQGLTNATSSSTRSLTSL